MTVQRAEEILESRRATRIGTASNKFYPVKDTVSIPSGGFTVMRFKADNPGFWIVHCHYEWHANTGMAVVFQVGETHEMVPPPADFPKCRNYRNNADATSALLSPQWIPMTATSTLPRKCHLGGHERNAVNGTVTYIGRRGALGASEVKIGRVKFDMKRIYGENFKSLVVK